MFKRLPSGTAKFFDVPLRDQLVLLDRLCRSGAELSNVRASIELLFASLGCSFVDREYELSGYKYFVQSFGDFYKEFVYIDSREGLVIFRENLIEFLERCFPTELDEEVYY